MQKPNDVEVKWTQHNDAFFRHITWYSIFHFIFELQLNSWSLTNAIQIFTTNTRFKSLQKLLKERENLNVSHQGSHEPSHQSTTIHHTSQLSLYSRQHFRVLHQLICDSTRFGCKIKWSFWRAIENYRLALHCMVSSNCSDNAKYLVSFYSTITQRNRFSTKNQQTLLIW